MNDRLNHTDELWLTEADLARQLKLSPRTLQAWRVSGFGPKFVKISSKAIRYRSADIAAWGDSLLRQSIESDEP